MTSHDDSDLDALRNHPLLRLLKFAAENESFNREAAMESTGLTGGEFDNHANQITFLDSGTMRRRIKESSLLDYLDFIELQHAHEVADEARKASLDATKLAEESLKWAVTSVLVSSALAIGSILISVIQSFAPPDNSIPEPQMQRFEQMAERIAGNHKAP